MLPMALMIDIRARGYPVHVLDVKNIVSREQGGYVDQSANTDSELLVF